MNGLSSKQLLHVWERGLASHPIDRALTILGAARPDTSGDDIAVLPLGERDRRLLALREATFGAQIEAAWSCPQCRELLELAFSTTELGMGDGTTASSITLDAEGYQLELRPPNSRDLAAVAAAADGTTAREMLARRCVVELRRAGAPIPAHQLPAELTGRIAARLESADPDGDVTLEIHCPSCGATSEPSFDIAAFLWIEIEAAALRLLHEVHALARNYGWSEADILALPAFRRRAYLEMLPS